MTTTSRFDRTLRTVMWLDAFLPVGLVAVAVIASPLVATVHLPDGLVVGVGIASIVCGVRLAGFGAVTAVVLMLRMRSGEYHLPPRLRLPLPAPLRPAGVRPGLRVGDQQPHDRRRRQFSGC